MYVFVKSLIPKDIIIIGCFYTTGANRSHYKAIVVARVRLGRFEVVNDIFMSHCLAFAAVSIRERSRQLRLTEAAVFIFETHYIIFIRIAYPNLHDACW
jgi:hypothetical protein